MGMGGDCCGKGLRDQEHRTPNTCPGDSVGQGATADPASIQAIHSLPGWGTEHTEAGDNGAKPESRANKIW